MLFLWRVSQLRGGGGGVCLFSVGRRGDDFVKNMLITDHFAGPFC